MTSTDRRAKGYRPDLPHRRTQTPYAMQMAYRVSSGPPGKSDMRPLCYRPILDQNECGTCGGHGSVQLTVVALASAGDPLPFCPSPRGIYVNTIALERSYTVPKGAVLPPLQDTGVMPSDLQVAIQTFGVRPMVAPSPLGFNSDVDKSNVTDEPKLAELEEEAVNLLVGPYRIDEHASDSTMQIMHALGSGMPVGLGCFVDQAFENWTPNVGADDAVDLADPYGGGHWLGIVGHDTSHAGSVVFYLVNSWGASWGDSGFIEVTDKWVKASASDLYVWNCQKVLA